MSQIEFRKFDPSGLQPDSPLQDHIVSRPLEFHKMKFGTVFETEPALSASFNSELNAWTASLARQYANQIDEDVMNLIFEEVQKRFSTVPKLVNKCNSCGARMEIDSRKHIFFCKYCGSAYVLGAHMINDRGD